MSACLFACFEQVYPPPGMHHTFRCRPVDVETKPELPLREVPYSFSTDLDLDHEALELLSSV